MRQEFSQPAPRRCESRASARVRCPLAASRNGTRPRANGASAVSLPHPLRTSASPRHRLRGFCNVLLVRFEEVRVDEPHSTGGRALLQPTPVRSHHPLPGARRYYRGARGCVALLWGVPRRLVIDNLAAAVTKADRYDPIFPARLRRIRQLSRLRDRRRARPPVHTSHALTTPPTARPYPRNSAGGERQRDMHRRSHTVISERRRMPPCGYDRNGRRRSHRPRKQRDVARGAP